MKLLLNYILLFISINCFSQTEVARPFANIDYNSMSIRPLSLSNSVYAFRLYANNSRSLDRIFTVSYDSSAIIFGNDTAKLVETSGNIIYIGEIHSKRSIPNYYSTDEISKERADSLINLLKKIDFSSYHNRDTLNKPLHDPWSSYFIEVVRNSNYYAFKFDTHYPIETNLSTKYEILEKLFFKLFPELIEKKK